MTDNKKPAGNLTKNDVKKLTSLNLESKGIKDLSGIENLTNLSKYALFIIQLNYL